MIDVKIEFPSEYVEYKKDIVQEKIKAIIMLCKGAAVLGEDLVSFRVRDITVLQAYTFQMIMASFGVAASFGLYRGEDGETNGDFTADVRLLLEKLDELGDLDE